MKHQKVSQADRLHRSGKIELLPLPAVDPDSDRDVLHNDVLGIHISDGQCADEGTRAEEVAVD